MNEPVDVATTETMSFQAKHLPHGAQVIEIGCGEGRVAQAFQDRGYCVVGLDADGETSARAKARGAPGHSGPSDKSDAGNSTVHLSPAVTVGSGQSSFATLNNAVPRSAITSSFHSS